MSFTSVAIGYNDRRYSFEAPDFGSEDFARRFDAASFDRAECATCAVRDRNTLCVACADLEHINSVTANLEMDRFLNSGAGETDDDEEDDEADEEEEDDDTDTEKALSSSSVIRI